MSVTVPSAPASRRPADKRLRKSFDELLEALAHCEKKVSKACELSVPDAVAVHDAFRQAHVEVLRARARLTGSATPADDAGGPCPASAREGTSVAGRAA